MVAFFASLITAAVQINKLPRGWHVSAIDWFVAVSPTVFIVVAAGSLYFGAIKTAVGFWAAHLLMNTVWFVRQSGSITRTSIAQFVLVTVVSVTVIAAIPVLNLIERIVKLQTEMITITVPDNDASSSK